MIDLWQMTLLVMRMVMFALALGLTLISFQAYRQQGSDRLEAAFIGFAFLSMGVAVTTLSTQLPDRMLFFDIVETIPFIIGFGMLYVSLFK